MWHATFSNGGSRPPVLITSYRPDPQLSAHRRRDGVDRPHPRLGAPIPGPAGAGRVDAQPRARGGADGCAWPWWPPSTAASSWPTRAAGSHTMATRTLRCTMGWRRSSGTAAAGSTSTAWTGGPDAGPNVVFARQDLPLIVDHGQVNHNLSDGPQWGADARQRKSTCGARGWASTATAISSTPRRTTRRSASLAQILVHAGAVRAMELDINSYWPSFITYRVPRRRAARQPAGRHGALAAALPDPRRPRLLRRLRALNDRPNRARRWVTLIALMLASRRCAAGPSMPAPRAHPPAGRADPAGRFAVGIRTLTFIDNSRTVTFPGAQARAAGAGHRHPLSGGRGRW